MKIVCNQNCWIVSQENAKLKKENISLRRTIEDLKKLLLGLGGVSQQSQEAQQSQDMPETQNSSINLKLEDTR